MVKIRLVYYAHALPECWHRQSDCSIINITCYKNVISMKRSARRQKSMCYIRCTHAVLTWLSKAISYATKALGYSEILLETLQRWARLSGRAR